MILLGLLLGGFVGGVLRYLLSRLLPGSPGTFAANMLGCLALGLTMGFLHLTQTASADLVYATAAAGLAGGLSTWSTLARELGDMLKAKRYRDLCVYLLASVAIGIICAARGTIWAARIYNGL
ncbi:CrcB family protein [Corynebacterium camporealensis]|uniref:CrcB family protein n=1 Tax=Corynebacterium camporealensis TaxID=161896 RepID=UPI0034CEA186